ncbi:uncharacterized protein LOC9307447 isoform X1 [Arabidopsis lyrata subsp. lyrata]|uniref:uncharacterized protein LOC9307447 isoform X1 n=1 Tax=Arabidopsis lyrata subsp. lyrata TaxID=81972 RepID=UPI000A29E5B2|nr:uncharacterized protein LOC9307447 isoform X1 [Arabidopsis lyrata subsp. lyrata]|eukprot:XP_002871377.2 uncharacterized protein LOC9307447 isoform X1 [Arabidopsis lyrata subsp. lyrata]
MNPMMSLFFFLGCSGRSSSRSSTPRSSPQPRASPAATYVSSSPAPSPAPTRSSSPRTERSTPPTYRTSSDDDYNLFGGIFRGMRSDDQDSSNDGDGGTSHGESLFGDTVRTLLCPPPSVVSEPVAGLVSPCDTQSKALQDCLNDFDTDINRAGPWVKPMKQGL